MNPSRLTLSFISVFILSACGAGFPWPGSEPTSLKFEPNGYGGSFAILDQDNEPKTVICKQRIPGSMPIKEGPDCADGITFPTKFLEADKINTERGRRFGVSIGSGGWHDWEIRARCWPERCEIGDYRNLSIEQVMNTNSQFERSPFEISFGRLSLNTVEIEYTAAPLDLDNVASFSMGLLRDGNATAILAYPAVYIVGSVIPGGYRLPDPKDGKIEIYFKQEGSYLAILPDKSLLWKDPKTVSTSGGCNRTQIRSCDSIVPAGVKACVVGISCPDKSSNSQ